MRYVISRQCRKNIVSFYQHVAKKYKHTYSVMNKTCTSEDF